MSSTPLFFHIPLPITHPFQPLCPHCYLYPHLHFPLLPLGLLPPCDALPQGVLLPLVGSSHADARPYGCPPVPLPREVLEVEAAGVKEVEVQQAVEQAGVGVEEAEVLALFVLRLARSAWRRLMRLGRAPLRAPLEAPRPGACAAALESPCLAGPVMVDVLPPLQRFSVVSLL